MTDNERNFIIELEALSRKYGLHIGGCGCCGSPWVEKLEEKQLVEEAGYVYHDQLRWVSPESYYWDTPLELGEGYPTGSDVIVGKEKF